MLVLGICILRRFIPRAFVSARGMPLQSAANLRFTNSLLFSQIAEIYSFFLLRAVLTPVHREFAI